MFDILDLIHDATKEANSFENHPAKALPLEERLSYLNGLALVMNADAEIDDNEKEYLRILIKSFDLDESCLNDFVAFAQAPDKDTIQAFFRTFRRKPLAQLFLFDAYMMGMRDGQLQDKERAVIDKMAEQLEILKGTRRDIFDLFCHIQNKDWAESSLYFSCHLLDPNHYRLLLDFYEVEIDKIIESTNLLRKERLQEKIIKSNIKWIPIKTGRDHYKDQEITSDFVNLQITYGMLLPFIQSMHDRGELNIVKNSIILKINDVETVILDMVENVIEYDKLTRSFSIDPKLEDVTATTVTKDLVIEFFKVAHFDIDVNNIARVYYFGRWAYFPFGENGKPLRNEIVSSGCDDGKYYFNEYGFEDIERIGSCNEVDMSLVEILTSNRIRFTRHTKRNVSNNIDFTF